MRNMGGLRGHMKTTFWVYLIGSLALAGVFPLAGFWSKEEILADAWKIGLGQGQWHGLAVYLLLTVAAFFTAFYMGRQIFMVFFGGGRTAAATHAHESPKVMLVPLIILAALSVVGGAMNLPGLHWLTQWLEHTIEIHPGEFNILVAGISTAVALGGIGLAYLIYGRQPMMTADDPLQKGLGPVFGFLNGKWYVDELYNALIIRPFESLSRFTAFTLDWNLWHDKFHDIVLAGGFRALAGFTAGAVDKGIVDRFFDGLGGAVRRTAGALRRAQTGYVRNYALAVLVGVLGVLSYFLFVGR
jgi:NADH-quinone oxidoreductase subunit L